MKIYTKDSLITRLREIKEMGWITNSRPGNEGGIGNTMEDLLEIEENNLPLPNAGEWEIKCQREDSSSLLSLFNMAPSPRAIKFVPRIFLPMYGWKLEKKPELKSFRQTINTQSRSDRGFTVVLDRPSKKILISFDSSTISERHKEWVEFLRKGIGLGELDPQPYWGFEDLHHKAGTKLKNTFYVLAKRKKESGIEYYLFDKTIMLQKFSFELFINEVENGNVLIDFDARTGHDHGTSFRIRPEYFPSLYGIVTEIIE